MKTYSPVNRPFLAYEMASALRVPPHRVEYVLLRYRIDPAFRAGRLRFFGPEEFRAVARALRIAISTCPIVPITGPLAPSPS
jgi:hypothetical protein